MKKVLTVLLVLSMVVLPVFSAGQKEQAAQAASVSGTAENPIVISVVLKDLGDYVEMLGVMEKEMAKDGLYVMFEPVQLQEGSYADAMSLMIQGGTIPDLMYFQGGDYAFAITQGVLEDLTPYIDNSKYLKDALGSHALARLENYPYLLWVSSPRNKVPVVRTDWFDQMETAQAVMENPTIDNYYAFLEELQTKFTHNTALTCQGATDGLAEIDMLFGQAFGATSSWVKGADGKYQYAKVTDAELAKLEFYAKLYRENLLDKEYLSKKYSAKEQDFYKGQTGLVMATQNTVVAKYENKCIAANGPEATLTVLPPAKGADGACYFSPVAVDKETRGWAISKYSDKKQVVFDILDWLAGSKGSLLDQFGFEGVHYEITSDGKLNILDSSWWARFHEELKDFDPGMEYVGQIPLFVQPIMSEASAMVANHTVLDNAFMIPDDYVTEWDAATLVYKEFAADFVSGKKTRKDWNSFVDEWNRMGGKVVTDYANTVLK